MRAFFNFLTGVMWGSVVLDLFLAHDTWWACGHMLLGIITLEIRNSCKPKP